MNLATVSTDELKSRVSELSRDMEGMAKQVNSYSGSNRAHALRYIREMSERRAAIDHELYKRHNVS